MFSHQDAHASGYQIRGEKIGSILVDDIGEPFSKIDSCDGGIVHVKYDLASGRYFQKRLDQKTVKGPMADNRNVVFCIAVSLHKVMEKPLGPIPAP